MILAFTGAGISAQSGVPTFQEQPGIRDRLSRSYARRHPEKYQATIASMQAACDAAQPNAAHLALAERDIPVITMNVDGLHQRAGSKHVLPIHGTLPDIVLYEDPAPLYQTAMEWVSHLREGDFFYIIGTSFYTRIAIELRRMALHTGADVFETNHDAATVVPDILSRMVTSPVTFEEFMARDPRC